MQGFSTKKEFLEYLGKNPDDRKLVDRMIHDWRACMRDWMYYLISKDEIIHELEEEIKELKKHDTKFVSKAMWEKVLAHGEIRWLEEKIKELESDLDFQISENERLEAKVKRYQDSIRNSYYYINDTLHKKVNRPDYKAIIKLEWMLPWEDNQ